MHHKQSIYGRKDKDGCTLYYGGGCCLSNMFGCIFKDNKGQRFYSSEQYYQYTKASFFGDEETAKKIKTTINPYRAKKIAKSIRLFDIDKWKDERYTAMKKAVYLKFSQNKQLMQHLLLTKPIIAESSTSDLYFGTGFSLNNPDATRTYLWTGSNCMGIILMDLRGEMSENSDDQRL